MESRGSFVLPVASSLMVGCAQPHRFAMSDWLKPASWIDAMACTQFISPESIGLPILGEDATLGQPMSGRLTLSGMNPPRERTPFGERLFLARTFAGLSQVQLAKAAGISQGTLGELEWKGDSSVYAVRLALACGVSPEWLAEEVGPMVREDSWPFRRVQLDAILALPPEDRAYIEGVLSSELERVSLEPTEADIQSAKASHVRGMKRAPKRKAA